MAGSWLLLHLHEVMMGGIWSMAWSQCDSSIGDSLVWAERISQHVRYVW